MALGLVSGPLPTANAQTTSTLREPSSSERNKARKALKTDATTAAPSDTIAPLANGVSATSAQDPALPLRQWKVSLKDLGVVRPFALRGVELQCQRLLSEIRTNVRKALFRNMMFDLFLIVPIV